MQTENEICEDFARQLYEIYITYKDSDFVKWADLSNDDYYAWYQLAVSIREGLV